jgi:hypothetical protein
VCAPDDTSFRKCSGFKLGHCEIQLRPPEVKTGQHPISGTGRRPLADAKQATNEKPRPEMAFRTGRQGGTQTLQGSAPCGTLSWNRTEVPRTNVAGWVPTDGLSGARADVAGGFQSRRGGRSLSASPQLSRQRAIRTWQTGSRFSCVV